jgi:hypothetical protein
MLHELSTVHELIGPSLDQPFGLNHHLASCRFFPSVYYLSTSKIAIAVLGNFAFAAALCLYFLLTKVRSLVPPAPLSLRNQHRLHAMRHLLEDAACSCR